MEKLKIEDFKKTNPDAETELVIFLSQEDYSVKDRYSGDEKPVKKFHYYNVERQEAGELSIRWENLQEKGADNLLIGDDWVFPVYVILKEWERNKNYQNLRLRAIKPTGEKLKLLRHEVL